MVTDFDTKMSGSGMNYKPKIAIRVSVDFNEVISTTERPKRTHRFVYIHRRQNLVYVWGCDRVFMDIESSWYILANCSIQ